jgi:hypothetical protein
LLQRQHFGCLSVRLLNFDSDHRLLARLAVCTMSLDKAAFELALLVRFQLPQSKDLKINLIIF